MPGSLSGFYSGIIAEPPKTMNKFRYLVFFDDGYASYIPHKDIRAVTQVCAAFPNSVYSFFVGKRIIDLSGQGKSIALTGPTGQPSDGPKPLSFLVSSAS